MRITAAQLRRIIKEEVKRVIREQDEYELGVSMRIPDGGSVSGLASVLRQLPSDMNVLISDYRGEYAYDIGSVQPDDMEDTVTLSDFPYKGKSMTCGQLASELSAQGDLIDASALMVTEADDGQESRCTTVYVYKVNRGRMSNDPDAPGKPAAVILCK